MKKKENYAEKSIRKKNERRKGQRNEKIDCKKETEKVELIRKRYIDFQRKRFSSKKCVEERG